MNKRTLFVWRDAILTLLVLLMLTGIASYIGHFIGHIDLHGLDPGKAAVKNLELLDIHYAYRAEHEEQAQNIVLVNTGSLDTEKIPEAMREANMDEQSAKLAKLYWNHSRFSHIVLDAFEETSGRSVSTFLQDAETKHWVTRIAF